MTPSDVVSTSISQPSSYPRSDPLDERAITCSQMCPSSLILNGGTSRKLTGSGQACGRPELLQFRKQSPSRSPGSSELREVAEDTNQPQFHRRRSLLRRHVIGHFDGDLERPQLEFDEFHKGRTSFASKSVSRNASPYLNRPRFENNRPRPACVTGIDFASSLVLSRGLRKKRNGRAFDGSSDCSTIPTEIAGCGFPQEGSRLHEFRSVGFSFDLLSAALQHENDLAPDFGRTREYTIKNRQPQIFRLTDNRKWE